MIALRLNRTFGIYSFFSKLPDVDRINLLIISYLVNPSNEYNI